MYNHWSLVLLVQFDLDVEALSLCTRIVFFDFDKNFFYISSWYRNSYNVIKPFFEIDITINKFYCNIID